MSDEELTELIADAITDSFDVDWSARDGARAVMRALKEEGLEVVRFMYEPGDLRGSSQYHPGDLA